MASTTGLLCFPEGQFQRRIGLFWRRSTANTRLMEETARLIGETAARPAHGHFTTGGIDDRIEATLPPVLSPKMVPRS